MTRGTTTSASQRQNRTIILAISQEQYDRILGDPAQFCQWIDENYGWHPDGMRRYEKLERKFGRQNYEFQQCHMETVNKRKRSYHCTHKLCYTFIKSVHQRH